MNISCPHCHRYFPVQEFSPGGVTGCPHCLRNVFLPTERIPEAFLIPLEGDAKNNRIPLTARMILGRSNEADIQVLDTNVSRQHAEIVYEGGKFVVRDLGSRNGVVVNEARVGEAPVKHLDVVRLGGRGFRFEMAGQPAGPAAPAVSEAHLQTHHGGEPTTSPGHPSHPPQRSDSPVTEMGRRQAKAEADARADVGAPTAPQPQARTPVKSAPDSVLGNVSMFQPPPGASALMHAVDPAAAAAAAAMAAAAASSPLTPAPVPDGSRMDPPAVAIRSQLDFDDIDELAREAGEGSSARAQACLQAVYRVSEALAGVGDIDALLARMLEQVMAAVPADRAYVTLKDETGGLPVKAARFREERHNVGQMVVSRTLLDKVMNEHVSLLIADALTEFQSQHSIISQGIRSVMCVPLAFGKTAFGAIVADTLRSRNAFDDSDLKMLTAMSRQASVALENLRLLKQVEENARTRGILERYLPPELIEQVVARKVDLKPGGQQTELSILFSDIRGFTQIAAGMEPAAVVELINEYFSIMVEVLFRHGATLDKFIGDSIMAFWGAPVKREDDALRAVRCALEMQEKLDQFNALMATAGQQQLAVGIGINTGVAVAGNIGSVRRFEYTILGDAVNVASRLQGIALGGQILISEATYRKLEGMIPVKQLPAVELKGRVGLVNVYDASKKH